MVRSVIRTARDDSCARYAWEKPHLPHAKLVTFELIKKKVEFSDVAGPEKQGTALQNFFFSSDQPLDSRLHERRVSG